MLIENFSNFFKEQLLELYPHEEAIAVRDLVFMHVYHCNRMELSRIKKKIMDIPDRTRFEMILKRLLLNEPVQYVLSETFFYGIRLEVNADVLIPRPETEFMVDMITKEYKGTAPAVLDICTGSGCIAIALKKNLPNAQVVALDISEKALQTAQRNAANNLCNIDFYHADIFEPVSFLKNAAFDIIISNPPYVTEKEKTAIKPQVLNFEPHLALFVPDEHPLKFYECIGRIGKGLLKKGGKIFFEINEAFGYELSNYFLKDFKNIRLKKDLSGKDRYLIIG